MQLKGILKFAAAGVAIAAAGTAAAQGVRTERTIGLALASEAATAAVEACAKNNYVVTATVVDRAGQVKAIARGDGASAATLDTSRRKAYTSAMFRNNSLALMEAWQKNPAALALADVKGVIALGGGVPIRAGNEVVGAIGVGGAPGGQLDEQCAMAAIDKIKDRLN